MLANAIRLLCTASFFIALAGLMSGCQSPPPPQIQNGIAPPTLNTNLQTVSVLPALQLLSGQQFAAAEADFQAIINTSTDQNIIQQAMAGLTLIYLNPNSALFDTDMATTTLDQLYQQMMRWPQNNASLDMLFLSANLYLRQRLHLDQEIAAREKAESQQQKLVDDALNLQRTIERLRRLTLQ